MPPATSGKLVDNENPTAMPTSERHSPGASVDVIRARRVTVRRPI